MQHYLLFDSGCHTCSSLAQIVEDESNGWLEIRSLRDPAMQEMLNRARPGWKWEPTLLAIEGEQVEVFTGWQLRLQMVRSLGLRQAGHIAQLISQFPATPVADSSHRRHFLKVGGAIVGGLALGLGFGLPKASLAASGAPFTTDATPLALMDPVIALMKNSRHLRLASKHFGAPDWTQVFKITYGPHKKTGYAVFLKDTSLPHNDPGASTVLIFGHELHPRSAKQRAGGKKQRRHNKALVFRMTESTQEQAKVEWFTPSAKLVATSKVTSNGEVSNQPSLHLSTTVTPEASFRCDTLCPNLTTVCLSTCNKCRKKPTKVVCGACLLCVGAAGIACYNCLTGNGSGSGGNGGGSGSGSGSGSNSGSGSGSNSGSGSGSGSGGGSGSGSGS